MNPLEISPDQLRHLLDEVAKLAISYLEKLDSQPILPKISGDEAQQMFQSEWPREGLKAGALVPLNSVVQNSRVQNGRFFGYVLGSGEPVAAIADLLASVLNQNVTAWRSSPAAVAVEKTVVSWLADAIGCAGFHGSLTGGGSSANLMGLAMAREAKLPANSQGFGGRQGVVYASEEVHMSIPKSIALLGIGRDNLRLIPTDESFHMAPEELESTMLRDHAAGRVPIAIVASAGTVNTGAVDPLAKISEVARRHGTWLHVDGAYGALAAIAARNRFQGLELADSISLDPHKWLYQPLDCGCILYRDTDAARKAFSHTGEYARVLSDDPIEGFAFFDESIELSRRFRALKVWLSLRYHGRDAFRDAIKNDLAHARRLAECIVEEPELELVAPVELSAVCFRYLGKGGMSQAELNRRNASILKRVNERGRVYLSNATLRAKFCLRACVVNHRTTDADIDAVVPEVLAAAADVMS
ncbi:MAG TPA: pyridoxal-dependent decarboxylase [Terriglobales bacterium]|nr:pyridoxal-dependent decarboxylase [Terriglobales bacterium]